MDGEIVTRKPNEQLVCHYFDAMMDVVVDLRVSPTKTGARLTHLITITPLTLMGKIMSPCIRLALPKQTRQAMESLKGMLEAK